MLSEHPGTQQLANSIQGLWFQISAPARILHVAFKADLSPLTQVSLPFGPDENHLWVLSYALALSCEKQTSVSPCNTNQSARFPSRGLLNAAIARPYVRGLFNLLVFSKETTYRAYFYCREFRRYVKKKQNVKMPSRNTMMGLIMYFSRHLIKNIYIL